MIEFQEDEQRLKLAELRQKQEEEFIKMAAGKRGFSYINLASAPIEADALRLLPEAEARASQTVVFQIVEKKLGIGAVMPDSAETKKIVEAFKGQGYGIAVFMISPPSFERAAAKYKEISFAKETKIGSFEISSEDISSMLAEIKNVLGVKELVSKALGERKSSRVTKIVEIILAGALAIGASDVHLEPEETSVTLRYRLDGVLNKVLSIDQTTYEYILSRIKVLSRLKLNVKTQAQDGRFSIKAKDQEIEVRTSIIPGAYNESIVLRILNPDSISVSLEELGIEPNLYKILEKEIDRPNGLILTTGPTGSGKTTTLYAFLKKVHVPGVKIITIEDPIEYHLPGIVQTQTDAEKGYTFLSGLRAVLRQDPDIIMVGEIRDSETAEIAVNASLTGHLVFSTLHTNDAAGTFPRLLDLDVNPKVLVSAVAIAMAQRLVRKLCANCKKEVALAGNDRKVADEVLEHIPVEEYKKLQREKVYEPVGCEKCNNTGYKGRIGIFEAILSTKAIETAVLQNPSEREIRIAAKEQGLLTMQEDGIVKILQGATSFVELRRVIDITE